MMAPTARAVVAAGLGAPLALAAATLVSPELWSVGAAWSAAVLVLIGVDGLLAARARAPGLTIAAPTVAPIKDGAIPVQAAISFKGVGPQAVDYVLSSNALAPAPLEPRPMTRGAQGFEDTLALTPQRRGEALISRAQCRWKGPLGLIWRQPTTILERRVAITPDIEGVQKQAERLFSRTALQGLKPQRDRGDGSEFDALVEFAPGMDRRLVAWKQSGRHSKLLAREVRAERNHQIALAIDTGRGMSDPLMGVARLDWSLKAALLLGYVGLKLGDRVSLTGFDAKPRLKTGFLSGVRSFPLLLAQSAALDYATEETNFTLGLTAVAQQLQRRSMIVVFTEFTDPVSAELMMEALGRLAQRHLIVFVTFPDQELEALRDRAPHDDDGVARAVIAHRLLQDRDIVLTRLRRMGAHIVTAPADQLGPALVALYDRLRRQERI